MKPKVHLFVYGLLKPEYQPPKSMSSHHADSVNGSLYSLGGLDAALLLTPGVANGQLLAIDEDELPGLDKMEAPQYRRQMVTTALGYKAYVYVYDKPLPKDARLVKTWTLGVK